MTKSPSLAYIIFISVLFSCLGQVAADLYLPSLPAIAVGLQTSIDLAQMTVTSYLIGYTGSFLVYGPISDAIGRKKPLIIGLVLFLLGTFGCVGSSSITSLIVFRLLQGLGAGAGTVLGGTIVRDLLNKQDLARVFSYLGIANIAAIANAPFLGGYLQQFFGWQASFFFLLIYGLIALSISIFFLSETNVHRTKENLALSQIKLNLRTLFSNRDFVTYTATIAAVYGAILAWLTLGPIFIESPLGYSPRSFGFLSLIGGGFYASGAFINSRLTGKFGINNMINIAASTILISGFALIIFSLLKILSLLTFIFPVFLLSFSAGIIFPNAFAGAFLPFQKISGFAGAIVGSTEIFGGVITSGIISILPDTTVYPMATIFIFAAIAILYAGTCRTKIPLNPQ